ncbi:MAG: hypothetical protein D6679_08340 [Candidatus Hydrogenedentota bacterium]|nr:MAG: hypothetical protein D6679_08340 [Candidatus Hydrogenedentota bacterium]
MLRREFLIKGKITERKRLLREVTGLGAPAAAARGKGKAARRRRSKREGFLLADALIAAAVIFAGLGTLVNTMPQLTVLATKQRVQLDIDFYAQSKQEELLATSYDQILPSDSGDFTSLLGSNAPAVAAGYTWSYTSKEVIPGIMKEVVLSVTYNSGAVTVNSPDLTFYVVDFDNVV